MSRFFNMTSKIKALFSVFSLLVIPSLFIIFGSNNTYATRVEVDVNNLDDYFASRSEGFNASYAESFSGSSFVSSTTSNMIRFGVHNRLCPDSPTYARVVYGFGFSSFVPSSQGTDYVYVSGSFNNGMIFHGSSNNSWYVLLGYADVNTTLISNGSTYSFDSITLGCSEQEVAPVTPTPTPTPTPTETPTPTPTATPDEINPDDYEYDPVEDSIVKYRFMSVILIFGAGLLLYHLIIKRIILR